MREGRMESSMWSWSMVRGTRPWRANATRGYGSMEISLSVISLRFSRIGREFGSRQSRYPSNEYATMRQFPFHLLKNWSADRGLRLDATRPPHVRQGKPSWLRTGTRKKKYSQTSTYKLHSITQHSLGTLPTLRDCMCISTQRHGGMGTKPM